MHRLVGCPLIRPCCPWWLALVCLPRFLPPLDLLTLLDAIEDLLPVLSGENSSCFLLFLWISSNRARITSRNSSARSSMFPVLQTL